jgi:primosomal protein N' (replication factor Y) (superfamily II helicase)
MEKMIPSCVRVSVCLPVKGTYHYALPQGLALGARVGCRVLVPFQTRQVTGYILERTNREEGREDLKEILEVLDSEPPVS